METEAISRGAVMPEQEFKNFEAEIQGTEAKRFINRIKVLNGFLNEAVFKIDSTGIKSVNMDSANVSMLILDFEPKNFYSLYADSETLINLNVQNFLDSIKDCKGFKIEGFKEHVLITDSIGVKTRIPLIEIDDSYNRVGKVPELSFNATITLNTDLIKGFLKPTKYEATTFKAKECFNQCGAFSIMTEQDNSRTFNPESNTMASAEVESRFSTEYLKKFLKSLKNEELTLKINKDYPLLAEVQGLKFILAPRVSND